mgnify:CR=1 FL=1
MTFIKHFLLTTAFALGLSLTPMAAGCGGEAEEAHDHEHAGYVCPMHPEVHEDAPGECPVCGMPLEEESEEDHEAHSH